MESGIDRFRLSEKAKEQLTRLKRVTKIDQWNILCRWAFCVSLSRPTPPPAINITTDSNVEMTWKVFGGDMRNILLIALKQRCHNDGLGTDKETLSQQFRLHLHRGIDYLANEAKINNIEGLVGLVLNDKIP
ncbi:MAG: hypothetical protein N5P05_002088 [Chroococcopsis gigantea SAG 12.99]|jgi:DNA sulfur modification protein DndE|nr:DNA sulfur modification protein DndE [Chlorogloea purpurea SAG 13.99]MDV3000482.1 hypothetical protein [Chroococcopsis gigantea SAG 12.99]